MLIVKGDSRSLGGGSHGFIYSGGEWGVDRKSPYGSPKITVPFPFRIYLQQDTWRST